MVTRANGIRFMTLRNESPNHSLQHFLGALHCPEFWSRFFKVVNYIHFVNALAILGFIIICVTCVGPVGL